MSIVRETLLPPAPPPRRTGGPLGWLRNNLFSGPGNTVATLVILAGLALLVPPLIRFLVTDAVWSGASGEACRPVVASPARGTGESSGRFLEAWRTRGHPVNGVIRDSSP